MRKIEEVISQIRPADRTAMEAARAHWDSRCKPLCGFGALEEMVTRLAGIQGTADPQILRRDFLVFGADNGVVAEGVSQTGREVTRQVMENMTRGRSSICVMARHLGARVVPVDIGLALPPRTDLVRDLCVRRGTANIAEGPAMEREECLLAMARGADLAVELAGEGTDIFVAGEMGIGNTTTAAACACALLDLAPGVCTGRGAGLSAEGLKRKTRAVERALAVNRPDKTDAVDVITKVGGLDIAAMTGAFLGAACARRAIFADGLISILSACLAVMLCPEAKDYILASHESSEPACRALLQRLGLQPALYAGMHTGEGTGGAAALGLLDQALALYRELPAFGEGGVEPYVHLS